MLNCSVWYQVNCSITEMNYLFFSVKHCDYVTISTVPDLMGNDRSNIHSERNLSNYTFLMCLRFFKSTCNCVFSYIFARSESLIEEVLCALSKIFPTLDLLTRRLQQIVTFSIVCHIANEKKILRPSYRQGFIKNRDGVTIDGKFSIRQWCVSFVINALVVLHETLEVFISKTVTAAMFTFSVKILALDRFIHMLQTLWEHYVILLARCCKVVTTIHARQILRC